MNAHDGSLPRLQAGRAEGAPVELVEVSGFVKWFDAAKGFGFVVPDGQRPGAADALLHVSCLRQGGFETIYEGTRIVCEATPRPKGLQVVRVISMDESTAIHPSQSHTPRPHETVRASSGLERAVVKWFHRVKGYGFVTRGEGTEDVFVHMETMRRFGLTELRPGQTVIVRFGAGPKGLIATEVRPDGVAAH